jgi:hypothetical protein
MTVTVGDVDIDFADRLLALRCLSKYTPASIIKDGKVTKHNTGIYVTEVPYNPETQSASLDYKVAEDRGYVKLDFLNVSLYQQVRDEEHLIKLMNTEPDWNLLYKKEFCEQLMHIGNHYHVLVKCPEKVDSIPRLAMFMALIRPAKSHLIGKTWKEIATTIWDREGDGYAFRHSHSVAYATLVVVHMNLLTEAGNA